MTKYRFIVNFRWRGLANKVFKNLDEQINILKDKGLIINDEDYKLYDRDNGYLVGKVTLTPLEDGKVKISVPISRKEIPAGTHVIHC